MAIRKQRDINAALTRKGFTTKQGDHSFYYFHLNGMQIRTKMSHGAKSSDVGDELLSFMARQCKLTKQKFLELVDCTCSQEDYEQILSQKLKQNGG